MADALFEDARLAEVHDALEGDRDDLEVYAARGQLFSRAIVRGCGTDRHENFDRVCATHAGRQT